MKKLVASAVFSFVLVGCDTDPVAPSASASMTQTPPISSNVAYYGESSTIDSAGVVVSARLLFVMGKDSSFKMYVSPKSLALYHPSSSLDLFRVNGKLVSWNSGLSNSMNFSVDSMTSHWGESGKKVKSGSVVITGDSNRPNVKYMVLRAQNEEGTGGIKLELQTSKTDSNQLGQAGLGI